jgi:uncharacterized membrane protein
LVKLAAITLAAGVLVLGSVDGAMAAKSGGRIGGQAFRSAPRSSGPRINNSRYKLCKSVLSRNQHGTIVPL